MLVGGGGGVCVYIIILESGSAIELCNHQLGRIIECYLLIQITERRVIRIQVSSTTASPTLPRPQSSGDAGQATIGPSRFFCLCEESCTVGCIQEATAVAVRRAPSLSRWNNNGENYYRDYL